MTYLANLHSRPETLETIMITTLRLLTVIIFTGLAVPAIAQPDGFHFGPVILDDGPVAAIENRQAIPEGTKLRVSMDVVDRAKAGEKNRHFVTAARFLNMHAQAGMPIDATKLALVIHGSAVHDVTNDKFHHANHQTSNANRALVEALLENGVEVYVCGQSAYFNGVKTEDLLPGVTMSLSAITAHALLQQNGYTLNPF